MVQRFRVPISGVAKHELDEGKVVNILKGAIATSDRVLTVSERHVTDTTRGR